MFTYERPVAVKAVVGGGLSKSLGTQCRFAMLLLLVEVPLENVVLEVGERGTSGAGGFWPCHGPHSCSMAAWVLEGCLLAPFGEAWAFEGRLRSNEGGLDRPAKRQQYSRLIGCCLQTRGWRGRPCEGIQIRLKSRTLHIAERSDFACQINEDLLIRRRSGRNIRKE